MKLLTIQRRWLYALTAAGLGFGIGYVSSLRAADERFDNKVRSDFFAGFAGNKEALDRAMAVSEQVLKDDPKNAEAMVWHGTGTFSRAGIAYRAGDMEKGNDLFFKATEEMDAAVALAPDSVGVRIPRGAAYLKASLYMPPEVGRPLIEKGITDYEKARELQAGRLDKLGEHSRGELLFGLGEAYTRVGENDKATALFQKVAEEMKGTEYAKRANKWLETKKLTPQESGCIGCHVK